MGGVQELERDCWQSCTRELEVEPLVVEDFARALRERGCDGDSCIREPQVEPLAEDFTRALENRGCGGDACIRGSQVEPLAKDFTRALENRG